MDKNDGPSARARSADLPEASEADLAAESDEVEAQDLALSPVDAERDEFSLADGGYGARPITRSSASLSVPAWANANPITRYFYECFIELRKTTWPANNETWTMTLIVIGMSIGVAVLLGAADYGFNFLVHWVLTLSGK
jgi:preprotein translocase SecE subunit